MAIRCDSPEGIRLIESLKEIEQPWTPEFFWAMNRLIPTMGVESVIVRQNDDGLLEVLLTQRGTDDLSWPGQWHVPGRTFRDTDLDTSLASSEMYALTLRKIWSGELGLSTQQMNQIITIKCDVIPWRHARGGCISTVFICMAGGIDFPVGEWFSVDNLPDEFLGGQEAIVQAVVDFLRRQ